MPNRSKHTDATKRKAVAFAFKVGNATTAADKFGVWESMIRRWSRDPRYGGKPSAFMRGKQKPNGRANAIGLPVNTASKNPTKGIRDAIPVLFACPHCGGRIRMGAES